jgi:ABC-type Fe3+-hydroxamate transport system substrate-binding protein
MEEEARKQLQNFEDGVNEVEAKYKDRLPKTLMQNTGKLHLREYCYIGGNLTIEPAIFDEVITNALKAVFARFY